MSGAEGNAYGGFAEVYDQLMSDVDYDAWAAYLISLAGLSSGHIAECACGTGQLSVRFSAAGLHVTGLDLSDDMLRVAAENARRAGKRIAFVRQDMCNLALHRPVDAVIAACDGVNYLSSEARVLSFFEAAYKGLKKGGKLLFDISSAYKLENTVGNHTFTCDDADCAYIWENTYIDNPPSVEMELSFFVRRGKMYERVDETHVQYAYGEEVIRNLLQRAGFSCVEVYDFLSKNVPHAQSERLQFVAVKQEG